MFIDGHATGALLAMALLPLAEPADEHYGVGLASTQRCFAIAVGHIGIHAIGWAIGQ